MLTTARRLQEQHGDLLQKKSSAISATNQTSQSSHQNPEAAQRLTHLNSAGEVHMVDISHKKPTSRRATAVSTLLFSSPSTYSSLTSAQTKKGDALAVTRIAAIQAVKQTATLIPLSHPGLGITGVQVTVTPFAGSPNPDPTSTAATNEPSTSSNDSTAVGGVTISTTVSCHGQTGIEMEALTGATVGALTMYDMLKGIDKNMVISGARVVEKIGGKSGTWRWDPAKGALANIDAEATVSRNEKTYVGAETRGHGDDRDVDEWNRGLADEFSVPVSHRDQSGNVTSDDKT